MTITATPVESPTRVVDARGSFCPGPLMELIRAIRESAVGEVIAVYSSDRGSHRLVGVDSADGYDVIVVEKLH